MDKWNNFSALEQEAYKDSTRQLQGSKTEIRNKTDRVQEIA